MLFNGSDEKKPHQVNHNLRLADEFANKVKDQLVFCLDQGQFYTYKDGYWKGLGKKEDELWLYQHEEITYLSDNAFKQFMNKLSVVTQVPLDNFNSKEILNLQNGVLDIQTMEFKDHSPHYLSTIMLPYKYDKEANHETWDYFLKSSLEGVQERIDILQEFMGYCLGKDTSFHKALILLGEGRNGKGTTFRIIQKIIGRENFSALKMGLLNKEERVSLLVNKLVNIDADCDTQAKGFESGFRTITGDDHITGKKLWKDTFDFKPFCKLIIGANDLPRIADKTHGFYDRLLIIPYNVSFVGKEDRDLDNKLEVEISGILNWALEGRKRLYKNGRFSMTKSMQDYVVELKLENNPLELFIHENIGFEMGISTSKQEMYVAYVDFCKDGGYHAFSKIKFGKEFFRIIGNKTQKDARSANINERTPIWTNIYLRGKNDPIIQKAAEQIEWENSEKN